VPELEDQLSRVLLPNEIEIVSRFLTKGQEASRELESPSNAEDPCESGLDLIRDVFLAAILGGQRKSALTIVEETLRNGYSHIDIYVNVYAKALHRIGELWEMNKISVTQEHMATSITQYAIAAIYPRLVPEVANRGSMVVTGVSGELHQIGANLVADTMEAKG
jgi:methanogenic corrinoid protein MtbC1